MGDGELPPGNAKPENVCVTAIVENADPRVGQHLGDELNEIKCGVLRTSIHSPLDLA